MYIRMLFVMTLSLFTTRVILKNLGVDDNGTYQVVGGVFGLLAFVNVILSQGTSRILLLEMGQGRNNNVVNLFSTLLNAHILLALTIALLAEKIGLRLVLHKLVIVEDRILAVLLAVLLAYHLLTCIRHSEGGQGLSCDLSRLIKCSR